MLDTKLFTAEPQEVVTYVEAEVGDGVRQPGQLPGHHHSHIILNIILFFPLPKMEYSSSFIWNLRHRNLHHSPALHWGRSLKWGSQWCRWRSSPGPADPLPAWWWRCRCRSPPREAWRRRGRSRGPRRRAQSTGNTGREPWRGQGSDGLWTLTVKDKTLIWRDKIEFLLSQFNFKEWELCTLQIAKKEMNFCYFSQFGWSSGPPRPASTQIMLTIIPCCMARLSLERAADWRPATTVLQSSHLPARTVTEWRTARPSKTIQLMPAALWWLINTEFLSMYKEIRQNGKCTNFTWTKIFNIFF